MARRRHHYESAVEAYLRARRTPYVSVDEARKALLPGGDRYGDASLKSFDFLVYGEPDSLLLDVKGRKIARRAPGGGVGRLESWVTEEDVASLLRWQGLFGPGFRAVFLFAYWCDAQPPDALFEEVFEHRRRWYALRTVLVDDYQAHMRSRSPRWRTVHLPNAALSALSRPFAPPARPTGRAALQPGRPTLPSAT